MVALAIILVVFLALLLMPRPTYPWVIAASVPIYVWLWWIITRPLPISDDWGTFDRSFISVAMIVGPLPALVRYSIHASRNKEVPLPELDWKPAQASCIFVAIWGGAWLLTPAIPKLVGAATSIAVGLLVALVMFGIAGSTSRKRGLSATAGMALLTGIISPLALVMFGMASSASSKRALSAAAGMALLTGIISVLVWPMAVIKAAEKRAAGRPYCLVVAEGSSYRTARNALDLTPLIMRGREGGKSAHNFHAELIVDGEARRGWSYSERDFYDKARDHTPPQCETRVGFGRDLRWF